VLSSISEGQPYAVIESMAAGRPVVTTNVGSCRELIEGGSGDYFGPAGICVPPMHQTELMQALLELCQNVEKRNAMAEAGMKRTSTYFDLSNVLSRYIEIYQKARDQWQASGLN
jgi:glycosyltransferase involved in cell wall biosynthesis